MFAKKQQRFRFAQGLFEVGQRVIAISKDPIGQAAGLEVPDDGPHQIRRALVLVPTHLVIDDDIQCLGLPRQIRPCLMIDRGKHRIDFVAKGRAPDFTGPFGRQRDDLQVAGIGKTFDLTGRGNKAGAKDRGVF